MPFSPVPAMAVASEEVAMLDDGGDEAIFGVGVVGRSIEATHGPDSAATLGLLGRELRVWYSSKFRGNMCV